MALCPGIFRAREEERGDLQICGNGMDAIGDVIY